MIKMPKRKKIREEKDEFLYLALEMYATVTLSPERLATAQGLTSNRTVAKLRQATGASPTSILHFLDDFCRFGAAEKKSDEYIPTMQLRYVLSSIDELALRCNVLDPNLRIVEESHYPQDIRDELIRYIGIGESKQKKEAARRVFYAATGTSRYQVLSGIADSPGTTFSDVRIASQQSIPASTLSNILTAFRAADIISGDSTGYTVTETGAFVLSRIGSLKKLLKEDYIDQKVAILKEAKCPAELLTAYKEILQKHY